MRRTVPCAKDSASGGAVKSGKSEAELLRTASALTEESARTAPARLAMARELASVALIAADCCWRRMQSDLDNNRKDTVAWEYLWAQAGGIS